MTTSTAAAKRAQRVDVVEGGAGELRRDLGRAGTLVRVEDMAVVAELGRGDRQHPAELAAAEDADGGAGRNAHSGVSATDSVCCSRQRVEPRGERLVAGREDRGGEQRRR